MKVYFTQGITGSEQRLEIVKRRGKNAKTASHSIRVEQKLGDKFVFVTNTTAINCKTALEAAQQFATVFRMKLQGAQQ